jgi:hypothetical protein
MVTINIIPYSPEYSHSALADFEEIVHQSMLKYSMLHLIQQGVTDRESFQQALQQALMVCRYAEIRLSDHFRQVYAYDTETGELDTDWLMSKRALKLIVMQHPELNKQMSRWLWDQSEI